MRGKLVNNYLPASIWLGYHILIPNWRLSFFSLLMLVRAVVVLFCFLRREAPLKSAPYWQMAIAWGSTFLPTLMVWEPSVSLMSSIGRSISVCGMVLFVFACLDLDRSFGISPAVRPQVTGGIYKFLNHPLYVSHVIVECGLLFASPSSWNFSVVFVAWSVFLFRAKLETQFKFTATAR